MILDLLLPFLWRRFPLASGEARLPVELQRLYGDGFNGGLFWGGALLVRPAVPCDGGPRSVLDWNEGSLWKDQYEGRVQDVHFFAEDVFGIQFGTRRSQVLQFDPETAELEPISDSIEAWAALLVGKAAFYTGAPALAAWQKDNGPLGVGNRLIPKKLFIFGGEYVAENLISKEDVEGMLLRAEFWKLTRDIPDGAKIRFRSKDAI